MQTLSCPHNRIVTMPPGLGHLQMLVSLDLSANKIEQVRPPAAVAALPPRVFPRSTLGVSDDAIYGAMVFLVSDS